jgi:hypothetical protein
MLCKSVGLAALIFACVAAPAWSQYPGYLPNDAARLGQDVNRQRYDQYRNNADQYRFNRDIATGNVGGAIYEAGRLQQDQNRIQYDRYRTQVDAGRVANDIYGGGYNPGYNQGGYNPGYHPGGYLPPAVVAPAGGFVYAGGQFVGP